MVFLCNYKDLDVTNYDEVTGIIKKNGKARK